MKIPALLTNKNKKLINQLNDIGINFGIIFQIIDDNLDYFGSSRTVKKKGQDFYEGKVTLPIILLLSKSNVLENKIVKQSLRTKRTEGDFNEVFNLLNKYNIDQERKLCKK